MDFQEIFRQASSGAESEGKEDADEPVEIELTDAAEPAEPAVRQPATATQPPPPLLPVDASNDPNVGTSREQRASVLSKGLYWYALPQLRQALQKRLDLADTSPVAMYDSSKVVTDAFTEAWEAELAAAKAAGEPAKLINVMKVLYRPKFLRCLAIFMIQFVCSLLNPFLIAAIADELEKPDDDLDDGKRLFWMCGILFVNMLISALTVQMAVHMSFRLAMHIKAALTSAVYQKAFRLHPSQRGDSTTGEMTNLMSNDAQRFADFMPLLLWAVAAPVVALAGFTLLGLVVGWPVAVAIGLLIPLMVLNGKIGAKMFRETGRKSKLADDRVKLLGECVTGVRVVKQYAWESALVKHLMGVRDTEAGALRKSTIARTIAGSVVEATPMAMVCVMFVLYDIYVADDGLDLATAVATLTLMQVVRIPILLLPHAIGAFVFTAQAVKRLEAFLVKEELDQSFLTEAQDGPARLEVSGATFSWDESAEPALTDVSTGVRSGELLAVVGSVGAGKSTLLQGMLGEVACPAGGVTRRGTVAYCQQVAWIQNATVRDNILFGREFDERWYNKVVKACALVSDFEVLQDGDRTEIGERGINLSGGQKQRVAIARAVYSRADVYVLDDVLSAVDAHVGKHIFEEVVTKLLADRAVVLATNQLQFLPAASCVLHLVDGRVAAQGSLDELVADAESPFAKMMADYMSSLASNGEGGEGDEAGSEAAERESSVELSTVAASGTKDSDAAKQPPAAVLIAEEERGSGAVAWPVYKAYMKYLGGWRISFFLLCSVSYVLLRVAVDAWVASAWVVDSYGESRSFYVTVYVVGIALAAVAHHSTARLFAYAGIRAASRLHAAMLDTVIHAPMLFFDATPAGRITNRFSRDQEVIDVLLPMNAEGCVNIYVFLLLVVILIAANFPVFLAAALPVVWAFKHMGDLYRSAARDCQRIESVTRSPIYSRFAETLNGIATIRAYAASERFIASNHLKVNANSRAFWAMKAGERWLGAHLELLSASIILSAGLAGSFTRLALDEADADSPSERETFAGRASVALIYATQMSFLLNWGMRQSTEMETRMNAVERSLEYAELDTEQSTAPVQPPAEPPALWPSEGAVDIRGLRMRYRAGLDPVLHGVDLSIAPREKIGICGRTGSGKSSLFVALLRLVNYEEGSISVDGVDVASLDVRKLRDAITIIPQDPVMFSGTVRFNLDPFERYTDAAIWDALKLVQLEGFVRELAGALSAPVTEGGDNFSVGQRQLVCLARALLRQPKVLLMDEATASVDHDTDAIIQTTVRSAFSNATVLTVAHRLNTILDSDRILVMDTGHVAEFAPPDELRADSGSMLSKLIAETSSSTSS